jgi:hypothetical protein
MTTSVFLRLAGDLAVAGRSWEAVTSRVIIVRVVLMSVVVNMVGRSVDEGDR